MIKKEFLVTHFMETNDGKMESGSPGLIHCIEHKDIIVTSLNAIYEALKKDLIQYHIYVDEVIDGVVGKRIQHIGWSRGRDHE